MLSQPTLTSLYNVSLSPHDSQLQDLQVHGNPGSAPTECRLSDLTAHLRPPEAVPAPGSAASAPPPKLRRGDGSRMGIMQQLAAQNPLIS